MGQHLSIENGARRGAFVSFGALALLIGLGGPAAEPMGTGAPAPEREPLGRQTLLPMVFVPHSGQEHPEIRYSARRSGCSIYFTPSNVVFSFVEGPKGDDSIDPVRALRSARYLDRRAKRSGKGLGLALRFIDSNPDVRIRGRGEVSGKVNFLKGANPQNWRTGLSTYGEVVYADLWDGVDAAFRGRGGQLKYEFVVEAGADPKSIRLAYLGADSVSVDERGRLRIKTPFGIITDDAPFSYQEIEGERVVVESRFVLRKRKDGPTEFGFEIGDGRDLRFPLTIDPGLVYSTYLGGAGRDTSLGGVAVDAQGKAYVAGYTESPGFPTTLGAFDTTHNGNRDIFVAKLEEDGTSLIYSTFIGGSLSEQPWAMTVDASGSVYLTGHTGSADFPTTPGAFDTTYNDVGFFDVFVLKLAPAGDSIAYATYLGGSTLDQGVGVAVDPSGCAYVTGWTCSPGFPTTVGAYDTTHNPGIDAFAAKLDPAGANLVYSTFIGGSVTDVGIDIEIDSGGSAYVAGWTNSSNFPATAGAFDTTFGAPGDGILLKLNAAGSGLVYSTFLGGDLGGFEIATGVAVNAAGEGYVCGHTDAADFPTTAGALDTTHNGSNDIFVARLDATASLAIYSTFIGGSGRDEALAGLVLDGDGGVYISGWTESADFPTTAAAFDKTYNGGIPFAGDAFVAHLDPDGDTLLYSTFLGGSDGEVSYGLAIDDEGNAHLAGFSGSVDFPVTAGAVDTSANGDRDGFVSKLSLPGSTPGGPGVMVGPVDRTTGKSPVSLTFESIDSGGVTRLTTSGAGDPPPTGFRLGAPPTYYEITTTATFSGQIEICIDYTDVSYGNECTLVLFHFEDTDGDGSPDDWVELATSSQDKTSEIICALSDSLSTFGLFEAEDTDGDGVPDLLDPDPLVAGVTADVLAGAADLLGDAIEGLDLGLFLAPNDSAAAGRRGSLAQRLRNASKAISEGELDTAIDLVSSVRQRVDGETPPADWIADSAERIELANNLSTLIGLIGIL